MKPINDSNRPEPVEWSLVTVYAQEFERWWAWKPVRLTNGKWVWGRYVWRSFPSGDEYYL